MIENINNTLVNDKLKSVYNYNDYSIQDLLSKFFEKINECIDSSNLSLTFMEWVKNEGLEKEVVKEIELMYTDGRLTLLINKLANDVNNKIETHILDVDNKINAIKDDVKNENLNNEQFKNSTNETLTNINNSINSTEQFKNSTNSTLLNINSSIYETKQFETNTKEELTNIKSSLNEKAKQIDLEVERKRIDNLSSLNVGVDNAETFDIRVGANGKTYPSAGESVRDQFRDTLSKFSGVSLDNLEVRLQEHIGAKKVELPIEYKKGYYINSNLQESAFSDAKYGIITTLKEGQPIHWKGVNKGSLVYGLIFVDSSDKIISKNLPGNDTGGITYDQYLRVPKGCVKVYVNIYGGSSVSSLTYGAIPINNISDYYKINEYDEETIINLNETNTEILEGQIYTSSGSFQNNASYSTLYYPIGKFESFILNQVGVFGGAFVTSDKKWISSFSTDNVNVGIKKIPPINAYYIAITVPNANKYAPIKGYIKRYPYNLNDMVITEHNLTNVKDFIKSLNNISDTNQWKGKKIGIIGTSVSFGQYSDKSYIMEIENKIGCTIKNFSVPGLGLHTKENGDKLTYGSFVLTKAEYQTQGQTIPSSPIPYTVGGSYNDFYRTFENVFTQENSDVDLWIFATTPNNSRFMLDDWNKFNKDSWKYTDNTSFSEHRTTFIGALLFIMDKMYTLNPNARMLFLLDSSFSYSNGKSNFEELSKQWNIPIIDLWGKMNTSPKSLIKLKSQNGTNDHPSTYAHKIMGEMLANELLLFS